MTAISVIEYQRVSLGATHTWRTMQAPPPPG